MYTSSITPALASVAMSRSDSRDSNYSSTSSSGSEYRYGMTSAPHTTSYSPSSSIPISRTTSNTSTCSSSSSSRRVSSASSRRDSANWISSPYRSCQQIWEEPSSFLSDDDLLYIAPTSSHQLPVTSIPNLTRRNELTTEEQIALLREQQEREQESEVTRMQQLRRQAAAAQKAVRFAPEGKRRPSIPKKKTTSVSRRS